MGWGWERGEVGEITSILLQAQLFFLSWPFGVGDLTDGAAAAGGRPKSKLCISLASSALRSFRKLSRFVIFTNAVDAAGGMFPPKS